MGINLDEMTLEQVQDYCRQHELWIMRLFVWNEGFEKAVETLARNDRI